MNLCKALLGYSSDMTVLDQISFLYTVRSIYENGPSFTFGIIYWIIV